VFVQLRHCSSVGSIGSRMSDRSSRKSGRFTASQAVESVVARVYLQTTNADSSNHYKSILVTLLTHRYFFAILIYYTIKHVAVFYSDLYNAKSGRSPIEQRQGMSGLGRYYYIR
jgi:hypothetical protein